MNCKQVEKLIYLNITPALSETELSELKKHLETCAKCKAIHSELDEYDRLVSKLSRVKTEHIDKEEFTNSVMNLIQEKSISLPPRNMFRFAYSTLFRVASICIILLSSFSYVIQRISTERSLASLEARYESKKNTPEFFHDYNECVEISQSQIADLMVDNTELMQVLENSIRIIFPKDIERFASKICQQPIDINTLDVDDKKRLLFTLLKQNEKL